MDNYYKKCFFDFFEYIISLNVDENIEKTINKLYDDFDTCDFDLCRFDFNNSTENAIREVVEYYYENIENHINNFSKEKAEKFILELKSKVYYILKDETFF